MKTKVYVFQISAVSNEHVQLLEKEINLIPGIGQWNFDLNDPDFRVLRIESEENISAKVISLFSRFNFKCLRLFPGRLNKQQSI
jgi:hypothetical protein